MSYTKPISYSSKKLYFQCPKRWYHQYILGEREPTGKAAQRGTMIHELLENFFLGGSWPTLPDIKEWETLMHELREQSPSPEAELAVNVNWEPVAFDDPDAYYRGKADLIITTDGQLSILDFKTGRIYPDHEGQGASYVAMHPATAEMSTGFIYLDHPLQVTEYHYTPADRDVIIAELKSEIETIRNDTEHKARGGDHCRWCPQSWRNSGKCEVAP